MTGSKWIAVAASMGALLPLGRAQDGKHVITPERLLEIAFSPSARPGAFSWFPDSRRVVFAIAEPGPNGKTEAWIVEMDVAAGKRRQIVPGSSPKLSPDGSMIAFLEDKDKRVLKLYAFQDNSTKILTELPPGVEGSNFGFAWSRDSRLIGYGFRPSAPPARPEDAKAAPKANVFVMGGEGDIPPDTEVWTVEAGSGEKRKVTSGPYEFRFPSWLPDSKTLVYSRVGSFDYRDDNLTGKVVAASVDGKVRTVVENGGVQHLAPVVSPDGKEVAFRYDPNNVYYPYYENIATAPSAGGPVRQWSRNVFVSGNPIWAPDGSRIYFGCKEGAYSRICSVTRSGAITRLTDASHNSGNFAISPDGKTLIFTFENVSGSAGMATMPADGGSEHILSDLTPKMILESTLGEAREVSWRSPDGLTFHGFVVKPAGFSAGRKYPLLVDLHGGPIGGAPMVGSIVLKTPMEWQMWAARGFVVFVADYRTGEIAGWEAVLKARERQDYNARDMDDIMAGIDSLAQGGFIDTDHIALVGHSNGSYLTNWLITHTHRFRVAVSYEGVADQYLAYGAGLRVGGNAFSVWMFKGKPWEEPQNYRANSADEFVKGVTTPTMFISNDYSGGSGMVNMFHHEFLYSALKKQGVDTQMVVYRGEGHVVQKRENLADLLSRVIAWVDGHIR